MEDINIRAVTWNVAAVDKPQNFSFLDLLGPEQTLNQQTVDLYVIGFQEVSARMDKYLIDTVISGEDSWTESVRKVLAPHGYIKVRTYRLLGIVLSLFCLTKHLSYLRNIQTQYTRLSFGGYWGLKGAVSIRMELYGASYCFVCSHLSAHDHMLESRVNEYNTIIEDHTYKSELTPNILYHDYIIWLGDLNFRLMENTFSYEEIVNETNNGNINILLEKDQLNQVRNEERAFHELTEAVITFSPTFKHVIDSDEYDTKRRPAWTDRILFRVNSYNLEDLGVRLAMSESKYISHTSGIYRCSDHRPVSADFVAEVLGQQLAEEKDIEGWKPFVRFFPAKPGQVPQDWFINQDGKISYELDLSAAVSRLLDPWDWIGLYHENFASLDDYTTFTWASICRRPGELKYATIQDSALYASGRYVLIYVSARSSILGISNAFEVRHETLDAPSIEIHEAIEAEELNKKEV